ncbi:MAG: hypothetical protein PHV28_19090 [Kiritimatiellae bacterium]|nr:hypothetical protein [Kiritimatiellia bacterium]
MRQSIGLTILAAAVTAGATTYTLNTADGTYDSPVALEDQTLTTDGSETNTFAQMMAAFTAGDTLVITGGGCVASCDEMANFTNVTSTIRIETNTVFIFAKEGQLGPYTNILGDTTAPTVRVMPGGTLAMKTTVKVRFSAPLYLAGDGKDGMGALSLDSSVSQMDSLIYSAHVTLTADASLRYRTSFRADLHGSRSLNLGGYTLTIARGKTLSSNPTFCFNTSTVYPQGAGHIVVDGVTIQTQTGGAWSGDASNTITFQNGARLSFYSNSTTFKWTLIWNTTGSWGLSGGTGYFSGFDWTNKNNWAGPVRIDAPRISFDSGLNQGMTFKDAVSGTGGLYANNGWLQFFSSSNSYEGALGLKGGTSDSGIAFRTPGSLPMNNALLAVTNAGVFLGTGKYGLRATDYYVKADTNVTVTGGTEQGVWTSLRKSGAGLLDVQSLFVITGKTDIAEGTLRVAAPREITAYSAAPGIWQGSTHSSNATFVAEMDAGWYLSISNDVCTCMEQLRSDTPMPAYDTYTWNGYVWNRSATNETWTFALSIKGYSRLYIDRSWLMSTDDNGNVLRINKTVTPGAHEILLKVNPRNYGGNGSQSVVPTWTNNMGFAIDRYGRGTTNHWDYVFPVNEPSTVDGGNGYWFTRDTRDVGDFPEGTLAALSDDFLMTTTTFFKDLTVRAGATLDLNCTNGVTKPLLIGKLSGEGTITNGSVKVTEALNVADGTAAPLTVRGRLSFADGATFSVDNPQSLKRGVVYTNVVADAIDGGLPAADALFAEIRGKIAKSEDGKALTLTFFQQGTTVFLR